MLRYIFFLLWSMDIYTLSSVDWLELEKIMCLDWDSNPGPPDCQLGKHYYSFNEIIVQCVQQHFHLKYFHNIFVTFSLLWAYVWINIHKVDLRIVLYQAKMNILWNEWEYLQSCWWKVSHFDEMNSKLIYAGLFETNKQKKLLKWWNITPNFIILVVLYTCFL